MKRFQIIIFSLLLFTGHAESLDNTGYRYSAEVFDKLESASIPSVLGRVTELRRGETDKLIIHLQDSHADSTAQFNITDIIKDFVTKYDIRLVCLEGASSQIDTSFYDDFPDQPKKNKIARFFTRKGLFTGAEYYNITELDKRVKMFGVEDSSLYVKNVEAYRKNYSRREFLLEYISALSEELKVLREKAYQAQLKSFTVKIERYHSNDIEIIEYLHTLESYAKKLDIPLKDYPNLKIALRLNDLQEQVPHKGEQQQRKNLIAELLDTLSKTEHEILMNNNLSLKYGKITEQTYFLYLNSLIPDSLRRKTEYRDLMARIDFYLLSRKSDFSALDSEFNKLEEAIQLELASDKRVRQIIRYSKAVVTIQSLFSLKLSRNQFAEMQNQPDIFDLQNAERFILEANKHYKIQSTVRIKPAVSKDQLAEAGSFYEFAMRRDDAILENTLKRMDELNQSVAILITGGFHTKGLTARMREQKVSYAVIRPHAGRQDGHEYYQSFMLGNSFDIEELARLYTQTLGIVINGSTLPENISDYVHVVFSMLYTDYITNPTDWDIEKDFVKSHINNYQMNYPDKPLRFNQIKEMIETIVDLKEMRQIVNEQLYPMILEYDKYTAGHNNRVGMIASYIGAGMGMSVYDQELLRLGGRVHDIGKINIPLELLNKIGELSPSEFEIFKGHPLHGFEIVSEYPLLNPLLPIILWHHERLNGKGYPHRLKNSGIPLLARIVAVADFFDALTSPRPYIIGGNKALLKKDYEVIYIMETAVAEGHLDPFVFLVFKRVYEKRLHVQSSPFWNKSKAISPDMLGREFSIDSESSQTPPVKPAHRIDNIERSNKAIDSSM